MLRGLISSPRFLCSNCFMKNELRKKYKEYRNKLNTVLLSQKIKQNLLKLPEYIKAKNILAYYSFGSEVYTLDYFSDTDKNWFLPKIEGENLLVCKYEKEKLVQNKYKIYEPEGTYIENPKILDMVIIPAVAADKNGYRLGYGKGFYDRFLKNLNNSVKKVVLVYDDLFVSNIFPENHDVRCSIIVTDKVKA